MKTIRIFTHDKPLLFQQPKRKTMRSESRSTRLTVNPTTDEKPHVDLNEIHRRFWAKTAGKE